MASALLAPLLQEWHQLLGQWARTGALAQAAQDALGLQAPPEPLRRWLGAWGAGVFADLPPVELVPAAALPAALGAYAPATGTIYLNAEWLQGASRQEALAVLTEELGHHLDAQLNSADTPGDEGELFAASLFAGGAPSPERRQALASENDRGTVLLGGEELEAELASRVVSTPIPVSRPGRTNREARNSNAFAALRSDGSVVVWGGADGFGGSTGVDSQLRSGVTQIFSSSRAFAALKSDGSVVTWSSTVLVPNDIGSGGVVAVTGVRQIFSNLYEFLALKGDGSLISFTTFSHTFPTVRVSSAVRAVSTTESAGAAIRSDGSVVTWGLGAYADGADSSAVASRLRSGVNQIFSTDRAFAALKIDGSVVSWGDANSGGNTRGVESQISSGVREIFANRQAFAALKSDGSVVTWGNSDNGGDSSRVASQLRSGVTRIASTTGAFAALKSDGSVITWGASSILDGGNSSAVADQLRSGVIKIFSTNGAFAALKSDGSVITWGNSTYLDAGNSSAVADRLRSGVVQIFSTIGAFAALKSDGSVVTWGGSLPVGGDSSAVADRLRSGVVQIFSTDRAFAALKSDGSVVTWGDSTAGGDSRTVANSLTNVVAFANPFTDDRLVGSGSPPVLSITPLSASKAEGREGSATSFTFLVNRSGDASGVSTAAWSVAGTGGKPANEADFSGGALPRGTVSFAAGQTSRTITVNVRGDLVQEGDETFRVSLSAPTGASLSTAAATGTILNDDLIGNGNRNTLVGTARAEFLDGRGNVDILTGGGAADVFGFRFGESPLAAPDRITDFAFGSDKIDLLTASGGALPAPVRFSRAANNTSAKSLGALSAAVFADANGALPGNQPLGANSAVLVQATNAAIAGTYLVVNNAVAGRSTNDDLMIKLNGIPGAAFPALGVISPGLMFVEG